MHPVGCGHVEIGKFMFLHEFDDFADLIEFHGDDEL
jgi:hypothetical protein